MTRRLAPMRLRPQPPALLLSMKTKSGLWEEKKEGVECTHFSTQLHVSCHSCILTQRTSQCAYHSVSQITKSESNSVSFILSHPPEQKNKEIQLLTAFQHLIPMHWCTYRWIIEVLHNLGSLLNGHCAIQANIQVPGGISKVQEPRRMNSLKLWPPIRLD